LKELISKLLLRESCQDIEVGYIQEFNSENFNTLGVEKLFLINLQQLFGKSNYWFRLTTVGDWQTKMPSQINEMAFPISPRLYLNAN